MIRVDQRRTFAKLITTVKQTALRLGLKSSGTASDKIAKSPHDEGTDTIRTR